MGKKILAERIKDEMVLSPEQDAALAAIRGDASCEHRWSVEHIVYGGVRGAFCVRRWCHLCTRREVGRVAHWRTEDLAEFDTPPWGKEGEDGTV